MRSRFHTVIFVPHSMGRTRQFRVNNRWLAAAGVVVALALLSAGWLGVWQVRSTLQLGDIRRIQLENEDLRRANSAYETSLARLQDAFTQTEDRTRDLIIVAGLDEMVGGEPENRQSETGAGGALTIRGAPNGLDVPLLEARAERLAGRLDLVDGALRERRLLLNSTPAIWPVRGVINSGFGMRRDPFTGQPAHHAGLDISADQGVPVVAAADGIVTRAERAGKLGRAVHLLHSYGYETRYGHLSEIVVEEGQEVSRGEVLGLVGNSGRATGYHLHYEVLYQGAARDPFEFLRDRG